MTVGAGRANADIILLGTTDDVGTGFGNVLNILTLQNNTTEVGSVYWDGNSDETTGHASNTSETRTIAELQAFGIMSASELGIVYNVNQQGAEGGLDTQLNEFTVDVYSSAGVLLGSWNYEGGTCTPNTSDPDCFPPLNQGTGGAGYVFGFDATQAAQLQAFWNPTNVIGMSGDVSLSNDGPENFFAYDLEGDTPDVPIPEPTSMFLLGSGLIGLAAKYRNRAQK